MRVYSYRELETWYVSEDGNYRYRWNIVKNVKTVTRGTDEEPQTTIDEVWSANEVMLPHGFTTNDVVEVVISEMWPSNREQKLVNEYNAAVLGISNGEEAERAKEAYASFLRERAELKAQVERDCEMLNIK